MLDNVHNHTSVRREGGSHVLLQLPRKNVLVEKMMQLLVGRVDTQLLERVVRKVLKPKNVEDADSAKGRRFHRRRCSETWNRKAGLDLFANLKREKKKTIQVRSIQLKNSSQAKSINLVQLKSSDSESRPLSRT